MAIQIQPIIVICDRCHKKEEVHRLSSLEAKEAAVKYRGWVAINYKELGSISKNVHSINRLLCSECAVLFIDWLRPEGGFIS